MCSSQQYTWIGRLKLRTSPVRNASKATESKLRLTCLKENVQIAAKYHHNVMVYMQISYLTVAFFGQKEIRVGQIADFVQIKVVRDQCRSAIDTWTEQIVVGEENGTNRLENSE